MQSKAKIMRVLATFFVAVFSMFVVTANAQSAYSVQYYPAYYQTGQTYYMGQINISNPIVATPATNTVATSTPVMATSSVVCAPVLNTYNKFGDMNTSVVELQKFLNTYNGANLNEKGYFGKATMQEVKNLQYAYGIKVTGAQYEKTTNLINQIKCGQVAKKDRVVYNPKMVATNTGSISVGSANITNIYPNPQGNSNPAPFNNTNKNTGKSTNVIEKGYQATTTIEATTTSKGLMDNFKDDFERVKENYKAYILVFVLVLALFWFLRKAATE